jgi:hypothetical protein
VNGARRLRARISICFATIDGYKIAWIDYDWRLNGTPPWPPRAISVQ